MLVYMQYNSWTVESHFMGSLVWCQVYAMSKNSCTSKTQGVAQERSLTVV